jgi:hypothetical protein
MLAIEDAPGVLDFRFSFRNILMWPFIRVYLYQVPLTKEYQANLYPPKERLGLSEKLAYLRRTAAGSPLRRGLKGPYDIIMFCSGITNVKREGFYFNRLSDHFAFLHAGRTLLVEDSVKRRYSTPRAFPNVAYRDYISLQALLRASWQPAGRKDVTAVRDLMRFIRDRFPYPLESRDEAVMTRTLLHAAKRLSLYYDYYSRMFEAYSPQAVFLEDASYGGKSYILRWASERGMATAELQHGVIYPDHAAYNYGGHLAGSEEYRTYLPRYFLMYGPYWSRLVNLPAEKVIIGNPNYSENIRDMARHRKPRTKTSVLMVSCGNLPDRFQKIVCNLASRADQDKYEIVFRPHPMEAPVVAERYPDIAGDKRVRIDKEKNIYATLANTDFVAGEPSTVLYEALSVCREVFVIEHPLADLLVPRDLMKRFSTGEDVLRLVQSSDGSGASRSDEYWAAGWEDNYRKFMNSLPGINI